MNSMSPNEITINEVAKEIAKLNPKRVLAYEGLSPQMIQCIAN